MSAYRGCCGCSAHAMGRRTFLASIGGAALGAAAVAGGAAAGSGPAAQTRPPLNLHKRELVVQPALTYHIHARREATSWRPWGGLHTEGDVDAEVGRIEAELQSLAQKAEFPVTFRPVGRVRNQTEAAALRDGGADVMLIYGASGGGGELETLISPDRYNLVFVRHTSGPVYLWYEIVHPILLRKTVDEYGQPGLEPYDVVVDAYPELLWRLRALYALKNTLGMRIVAIGGSSGWGRGGQEAPAIASDAWRMDVQSVSYEELGRRLTAAKADPERVRRAEEEAAVYLQLPGTKLETDKGFVSRAFLLKEVFEGLMAEADAYAITVNNCMSVIMPISETTACLTLSLLNDSGALAFCESDFVVIPSGVLLHHVASTPVFLQDPTYPHDGLVTLAHCTAPRKMDGKRLEKARILTHFESDYGAAPKVDMRVGQVVTVLDPDFANRRWVGFRGTIAGNPFLDICRSQVEVAIEGDWRLLMEQMRGFHWMLAYGDHLKETGYALRKRNVGWLNVTTGATVET